MNAKVEGVQRLLHELTEAREERLERECEDRRQRLLDELLDAREKRLESERQRRRQRLFFVLSLSLSLALSDYMCVHETHMPMRKAHYSNTHSGSPPYALYITS